MASPRELLLDMLAPVVHEAGFDLEDVAVTPAGKRGLVRVVVDKDGGVGLDDIAEVSRPVSTALDSSDALGDTPYVLEVSSPGVDRPLREPRHWRRAVGRLVSLTLDGGESLQGRLTDFSEDHVTLDVDGARREIGLAGVVRARVEVEFTASTTTETEGEA